MNHILLKIKNKYILKKKQHAAISYLTFGQPQSDSGKPSDISGEEETFYTWDAADID